MNNQSRETNSIRNAVIGMINQITILFLNLVSKTIFIKCLGAQFLGLNGLFTNIFMLFSFAEFGISSAMMYSLYEPIAQKDEKKISGLYCYFAKLYKYMALLVTIVGVLLIPFLKLIVKTNEPIPNLVLYYILFLINTVIFNMFIYKSYLIIADQKKYIISIYQLFFELFGFSIQVLILILTKSYLLFLISIIMKSLLSNLCIGKKVKKIYKFIEEEEPINEVEKKKIFVNIKDLFIYKFSRVLITGTDNIIISTLVGTVWVGYYSNYDLIVTGVISLITMLFSAVSASLGNFIVEKNSNNQYKIFNIIQMVNTWVVGFTTTCLIILFQDFITLWIGKEFLFNNSIVLIIVINYFLAASRISTKVFREAAGMFSKIKYVMGLTAIINIILSIILGKLFGIGGVFIATIIAVLSTYYWYEPKVLIETQFGCSSRQYFINQGKGILLVIISVILTYLCTSFLKEVSIVNFIMKAIICCFVSNIFYVAMLWKNEEFKYLHKVLINQYKSIKNRKRA